MSENCGVSRVNKGSIAVEADEVCASVLVPAIAEAIITIEGLHVITSETGWFILPILKIGSRNFLP